MVTLHADLHLARPSPHLHPMQQHRVRDAHAVGNLTLNADGDIGANTAVLANLGGGVHHIIAHEAVSLRQAIWVPLPD